MTTAQLQTLALSNSLKALPGGDLIVWLESKLGPEDFAKACDYILETILSQLVLICEPKIQEKLSNFLTQDNFEAFFATLSGLLDPKTNPQAAVFQYQIADSLQLGFEVVCAQYALDLNQ